MVSTGSSVIERLRRKIPFTAAMGIQVLDYQPQQVTLLAPLDQNLNYHQTAFGGSIATLGILAGWMVLNLQLNGDLDDCANPPFHIVIQESRTEYLAPIDADFRAVCRMPDADTSRRFDAMLQRHGRGRITLVAEIMSRGALAARETGIYVATRARAPDATNHARE